MKETLFNVLLSPEDRYRHTHVRVKGHVLQFTVQFETQFGGKWYPVVRYDTSHGFAHRDILDRKGGKTKTPLFINNFNEALTFAEYDIRSNWKHYKEGFLKEWRS